MSWKFDKTLAPVFVDHARKHIPDYDKVINMSVELCKQYSHDAAIVDIGCATGQTLSELNKENFSNLYGIDNSQDMLDECPNNIATYINSETYPDLPMMDVIICNWTLHFIKEKEKYLKQIKNNLNKDGLFILSEKTSLDPYLISKYHEFKRTNGVSLKEIKEKEQSLTDVMNINSVDWYLSTLNKVGFNHVDVVNAHYCFTTFICRL